MKKVIIYSRENCGACKAAKMFMSAQKISFTEVDIDESQETVEYLNKHNVNSLPFIEIGEVKLHGFNPGKILAAVK